MTNEVKEVVNKVLKDFIKKDKMFTYYEIVIEVRKMTDKTVDFNNVKNIIDNNFLLSSIKDHNSLFTERYKKTNVFITKNNSYNYVFHPEEFDPNDYDPKIDENEKSTIEEKVDSLIKNITNSNHLYEMSYLELIELVVDVENEYNLSIDPDDCQKMTKNDFINFIKELSLSRAKNNDVEEIDDDIDVDTTNVYDIEDDEDIDNEDDSIDDEEDVKEKIDNKKEEVEEKIDNKKEDNKKEDNKKVIKKDSRDRICIPKSYLNDIGLNPYDMTKVLIGYGILTLTNERSEFCSHIAHNDAFYKVDKSGNVRLSSKVLKDANLFECKSYSIYINYHLSGIIIEK